MRSFLLSLILAGSMTALAGDALAQSAAPPDAPFRKVSELVELPEFLPGLGILYVDPATLPAGPFLAFDREGALQSTLYMIPLSAMNDQRAFAGLAAAHAPVDRVDVVYNAGHPGVAEPHYHVILWHVSPEATERLAR